MPVLCRPELAYLSPMILRGVINAVTCQSAHGAGRSAFPSSALQKADRAKWIGGGAGNALARVGAKDRVARSCSRSDALAHVSGVWGLLIRCIRPRSPAARLPVAKVLQDVFPRLCRDRINRNRFPTGVAARPECTSPDEEPADGSRLGIARVSCLISRPRASISRS